MFRDLEKFNKNSDKNEAIQLDEFERIKEKTISEAKLIEDEKNRNGMLAVAYKLKFQFDKTNLLHYGKCSRFGKEVSFIPNICQIETQNCFKHRIDFKL